MSDELKAAALTVAAQIVPPSKDNTVNQNIWQIADTAVKLLETLERREATRAAKNAA